MLDFGGKEAIVISKILLNTPNEDLTDERIAELSGVKLNIVRKILYILNENKLTEFQRVRDKRSGWYIYYWTETFGNLPNLLSERKDAVAEKLDIRMKFEAENFFFICNNGCAGRFIFIDAMDLNFNCPNCDGGILSEERNKKKVSFLKDTIIKLRNE
ncbi:transcription factor [Promethearchaeum syntrophicum]|uniref:Transcription factor E n=1 Tax=Promethearchaeum syntrophicum TaxID=2594042 RepID=A0A5B9D6Z9_9ARCH|nr:transcription factor [Candidatus Prometheoarchaeum syntrophicum]